MFINNVVFYGGIWFMFGEIGLSGLGCIIRCIFKFNRKYYFFINWVKEVFILGSFKNEIFEI